MIAGAAQADFAVLVIDSSPGEFEAGFNIRGQTKEHALLVRSMGIQRIIVAVNKLDLVSLALEKLHPCHLLTFAVELGRGEVYGHQTTDDAIPRCSRFPCKEH